MGRVNTKKNSNEASLAAAPLAFPFCIDNEETARRGKVLSCPRSPVQQWGLEARPRCLLRGGSSYSQLSIDTNF